MYSVQHRPSITGLWHTYMKYSSERSAIMRADQLKREMPTHYVRVINEDGALVFQA